MVRKLQTSKNPNKKGRNGTSESDSNITRNFMSVDPNVHKRNLYIVSFPVIFLFNILRSLLYQLFIIIKYIYSSTSRFIYKPVTSSNFNKSLLVVVDGDKAVTEIVNQEMPPQHRNSGPGPGDPLLAKQKHHHRRAFEFISKALKIDEENEGGLYFFFKF